MSMGEGLGTMGLQIAESMKKSGVVLAEVTNIKDPDNLNRVKCKPVSSDADVAETDWCHIVMPAAGKQSGFFFFPNVGDLVVLTYLGGNIHFPLVLGRYWTGDVPSPYSIKDGVNEISAIKTPSGIEMYLDDKKNEQKLTLTMPSGACVQLLDKEKSITLKDKAGKNCLTILWEKGEIEIKAETKLTLSAGGASIVLQSSGSADIAADKAVNVSGADISLKGKSSVKLDATTAELKASGTTTVKGAMVKIN